MQAIKDYKKELSKKQTKKSKNPSLAECKKLLKECLSALNDTPRFTYDETDSYKLASKIDRLLGK